MKKFTRQVIWVGATLAIAAGAVAQWSAPDLIARGKQTFRYDTFGDEAFWGDQLKLHLAISGEKHGGVGPGISPKAALAAGLKVDSEALPEAIVDAIRNGQVDLDDPGVTLELLKLDAVVGVKGIFRATGKGSPTLASVGIQCALCHSTVDNSFTSGIGKRLDGWANRDLNVGAIVSLSPNLKPFVDLLGVDEATVKSVLASWGPGKFDAALFLDGKAFRPDGKTAATLIPPAHGLAGVNLHTYTGWGSVPYWNAFVANLEMHGQGNFFDPRLDDPVKFPVAAKARMGHVRNDVDLVTPKLEGLHAYQLSLEPPVPRKTSFIPVLAARGKTVFEGKAKCAQCHVPPLYTEPGYNLHKGSEIGIDDFQAKRSPDEGYRTTPLRGLFARAKGGYYHDGRFRDLNEVVDHYDSTFRLRLNNNEKGELVEFLKSL